MYFLDTLILAIFAIAFSSLGQASQVAEKCLQGCQSKALLSPENINCSVDEISPCSCAWTPMRDINFCCLVNNCLLSPDEAILRWTADCAGIGVPVPMFSIEIPCLATGKASSSTLYSIAPRTFTYYRVDSVAGFAGTVIVTETETPTPTISQVITAKSSIVLSGGGSSIFNSEPSTKISTPLTPSSTTALPATAPQNTSSSNNSAKTTTGDSQAKDEMKKLGIILGSSIPATIVLFLVAIFFWIRRLKPKKRAPEVREQEGAKSSGVSEEGLANIAEEEEEEEEEEGEGGRGGGSGNSNQENASRLSELHSDPIRPYSTELPGTPAPQLIELPA